MSCCETLVNCLPVLSILSILGWSYYAYVMELCIYTVKDLTKQISYLIVYHIFFVMITWSYVKVLCTDIAVVPIKFKIPFILYEKIRIAGTEAEKNNYLLEFCDIKRIILLTRTDSGCIRFCMKCKHVKPDRAHHCSTCGTCVLKMDHHCPWVNNCIGFSNHKYFVLFLFYTTLYCTFYFATTLEYSIQFWQESFKCYGHLHIIIGMCIALAMGILVLCFFCYHLGFVFKNSTTLESLKAPTFRTDNLSFNIGPYQNFIEIFGDNYYLWLLPIETTLGDGISYPIKLTL